MIAYTAWDSLQTIARQIDADLVLDAESRLALAPRQERCLVTAKRHIVAWAGGMLGLLPGGTGTLA